MKVIDILNKIANGEEGRFVVKQTGDIYNFTKDRYLYCETHKEDVEWFIDEDWLNYEVEIIEEDKKIEKIDVNHLQQIKKWKRAKILGNKINEIIDYLEEKE